MFSDQPSTGPYRGTHIAAVEVHGVASDLSLAQLRTLFGRVAPVLQTVAALDSSDSGVALVIYGSQQACDGAVELFDGFPLGKAFLHVKRAENLPNSLINLLYSLVQPTAAEAAAVQQQHQHQQKQEQEQAAAAASSAAAAAFLGQQLQQHQQKQQQEQEERQAWQDAAEAQLRSDAAAAAGAWGAALARSHSQQLGNGLATNGHSQTNGSSAAASQALAQQQQQQQQLELEQLGADLRQMQLDQQQRQQAAAAVVAAAAQQQQQQASPMTWASAAAAVPPSAAVALAASGGPGSDEWQMAGASRGRHGRRSTPASAGDSASAGQGPSSVSSGSPRPTNRSSGRRSDDKVARPGGQDGASTEPTTKLWMGGVDGAASAETVRAVFGRFGPIFDYELQPATHEKGRTDQWGFVNFKRLGDAARAYETLVGEVIPELTGTRKLKLQFRPVDVRRGGAARR